MAQDRPSHFIAGVWRAAENTDTISVISASTEQQMGLIACGSAPDVDAAVRSARAAFDDPTGWACWSPQSRAKTLEQFADALAARSEEIASTVSRQNGMPLQLSRVAESVIPRKLVGYYADLIAADEGDELRRTGRRTTVVRRSPVGVVAAIVPWNFPQSLTFFKLAPALAAGCAVVVKPSPETSLDAFVIAEAAAIAGLPPGVINIVTGGRDTGAMLVQHPLVDKVAFTGSTAAGRSIAARCGELLRPATLELGGKSAAIVLDDIDLSTRLPQLFAASLLNAGQMCYASTRILAPRSRYTDTVDIVTDLASSLVVGDPLDERTQVGPLVSRAQRERVERLIAAGRAEGARVTTGGSRPAGMDTGWYVEPTVFADMTNEATVAREEIFGPVLTVIGYDDVDDAVRIANDSPYGLGGTVWSEDLERAAAVARRVRAGAVGINQFSLDLAAPFGGMKASGLGRELGPEGLDAYREFQSIYLPA
jgi:aldehyde dehydrogenase (NAD+)